MALEITCDSPPAGRIGIAYSHTFPVTDDTPPNDFSIIVGILPPGLTLAAATGVVSGIPTTPGDFEFTIQVDDSLPDSASAECSISICSPNAQGGYA